MSTVQRVETEAREVAVSDSVANKGFFGAGVDAVSTLAQVTKTSGMRSTCVATGIILLLALVAEFVSSGNYVPHVGEIIVLISAVVLMLSALAVSSMEYKWHLDTELRKVELLTEQLRIEAHFNMGRLKETNFKEKGGAEHTLPPPPS